MNTASTLDEHIDITLPNQQGASHVAHDNNVGAMESPMIGSQEWLQRMKDLLRELQPPMSAVDKALAGLSDEIRQRREAGCSTADIAALLSLNGLVITPAALARQLRGASKGASKKRRSRERVSNP